MSDGIRELGDLQRLDLRPGDRFVLTIDANITDETAARIQEQWSEFFEQTDAAPKLLILQAGMKLGVVNDGSGAQG